MGRDLSSPGDPDLFPQFQVARRFKRANRAWDAGRYTEAARHLEEVRRKRPGLKGLNYLLGLAWQEAGEPGKAAPYYEEHLNLEPDDHRARFNLAVCYAGDHPGTPLPFCSLCRLKPNRNCRSSSSWAACSSN